MTPEKELLLAVLRQAIRDYIRLDPDSDTVSAEYYLDEGQDYKTAEDFLYNGVPIPFGKMSLQVEDICGILGIDLKKTKKKIAKAIIEY
jgi:hypothetical protein